MTLVATYPIGPDWPFYLKTPTGAASLPRGPRLSAPYSPARVLPSARAGETTSGLGEGPTAPPSALR